MVAGATASDPSRFVSSRVTVLDVSAVLAMASPGAYRARLASRTESFGIDTKGRSVGQRGHARFRKGLSSGGIRKDDETGRRRVSAVGSRSHRTTVQRSRGIRGCESLNAAGRNGILEARSRRAIVKRQDHGRGRSRAAARSKEPDRSRDRPIRWVHENGLSHPSTTRCKVGDVDRLRSGRRQGGDRERRHQELTGFVGESPKSDDRDGNR